VRNIVSLYFFLFKIGRAKCLSREQCVGSVAALCCSGSMQIISNGEGQL